MKATITGNKLTIVMDINEKPSASGKNIVIATSGGNQPTDLQHKGKAVVIGVNAYIKKD